MLNLTKLQGLDVTKKYQLVGTDQIYGGDELTYVGISIPADILGDFTSYVWKFAGV
ncbi:GH36 C-terminal domain-containing protein [Niallia sp. 03133]|uniref:GH36 C-terminal domain-containing protein n=1 Tax=Niallia sp. 03133 TaxID=3458060 RepID=UPI004044D976